MATRKPTRKAKGNAAEAFKAARGDVHPSANVRDRIIIDALRAIDRVDAIESADAEFARSKGELQRWAALDVAREALRAAWGERGEEARTRHDAFDVGDEEAALAARSRIARRRAMIDAARTALAGSGIVEATAYVTLFARKLRERPTDETYLVGSLLRLLATDLVEDIGDLTALRSVPARVGEIAEWLRHCEDGPSKRGRAWTSPPHAILARIVEASHGRATDARSIKPVVIEYAKTLKARRSSTGF